MVTTSNTHVEKSESKPVMDDATDELRREGELAASAGLISKRTMAIAFGLVFLVLALTFAPALGRWGTSILSLLGIFLTIWGAVHREGKKGK